MIHVTVWNEFRHEQHDEHTRAIYPQGIHAAIAGFLDTCDDMTIRTATLDEPEHGLTVEVLQNTDVLIWWGHLAHGDVQDEIVDRVMQRLQQGMGIIALHSAHASKIFRRICGTNTNELRWRERGDKARVWIIEPSHPIVQGLPEYIDIPQEETYGEHFGIAAPDELLMINWYPGGEVFRSGCCYKRGRGRVFYFQPGHETYPVYHQAEIQQVIKNAVRWAAPSQGMPVQVTGHTASIEQLD